jgi:hypothetical protein
VTFASPFAPRHHEHVGKGYAEGPAAEEAARRLDELAEGTPPAAHRERAAVYGCTDDDPERHFIGWADEVDADELFAAGRAWGIQVVRRVVPA